MKRPEGFDPAQRRQAAPPPSAKTPSTKTAKAPTTRVPKPGREPGPAKPTKPVSDPSASTRPSVDRRSSREAAAELRRAARERRRYERTEVRRFTRRSRNRRIGILTAVGVVVVLGVMLAIAVFSPILSLRTIRVEGTSRVDAATVKAAVTDQLGSPLALVDFDRITKRLGAIPLIRSYTTETVPPDTLVITVTERSPVGVVDTGSGWELVDPAGIVVQTTTGRPKGVPVIDAGALGGKAYTAAAEVLLSLPATLLKRVDTISATTEDDVAFTLGDTEQNVIWGSSERSASKVAALQGLMKANKKKTGVDFNVSSPEIALVIDKKSAN